jgi:hypothetical protein
MAKLIRVWDGTTWQEVGPALPNALTIDGTQTLTNKTISGASNTLTNIPNNSLTNSSITVNGSAVSLGGSVTIVTGPASSAVSSNITMASNNNYFVDTATNNITIVRNGSNINGVADNAIIDVNQSSSLFVYTGSTVGWRFD